MTDAGLGLPKRFRQADATALTGFQFATTRSQAGMPWVGTKVFDTNTIGKKKMNPAADPDAAETRDERFDFGLDCVLEGIAARLA